MPRPSRIPRPAPSEHVPAYAEYVASVRGDDAWPALASQLDDVERALGTLPEERALHRYAPGKWSVKQVVGHVADNERVYAYRALCFARGDPSPLPNFDENVCAENGGFDARPLRSILEELRTVRAATLSLYGGIDGEALARVGIARGNPVSVRALAWIAVGHVNHHLRVLRERYGIG
jgi:hypothetical protein